MKVGENKMRPYGTLTAIEKDFPEFSIGYLQRISLSLEPKLYKGHFLYRINPVDVIKNKLD